MSPRQSKISHVTGRRQARALRMASLVAFIVAGLSLALQGRVGIAMATAAITIVVAAPLVRVGWLIVRWLQEYDRRFVLMGFGLLGVVAVGALLSVIGVGR